MKTIGVIALSGNIDKDLLHCACANLESFGYKIKLSKNILEKDRYLAGSDECKINALYELIQDSEIDIIMCARGGYGAIRLINQLDYKLLKNFSKPICGYSDVTALLLMIYKKTSMITYHGPMFCTDFAEKPSDSNMEFTYRNFVNALKGNELSFQGNIIYREGDAEGIIWGGNLATVVSLCGVDFIPEKDFIFFAEDLNEPVYKIDKMFTQLYNISTFKKYCKGIVLGDFLNIDNQEWFHLFFKELGCKYNIPILGGFQITHKKAKITLPIGSACQVFIHKAIPNMIIHK